MPKQLTYVKPSKARVALALLLRLTHWPDLWRRVKLNIGQAIMPAPMGQGSDVATAWAASISIDEIQALARLGLEDPGSLSDRHADLIAEAARIEQDSRETLGGGRN